MEAISSKKKSLSFSIVIPVYKGSHLLKHALNSIVKQKFNNYEIIIGDDNPPELKEEIGKTRKIIESYHDNRIRYFKNKKNLGYPKNIKKIALRAKNDVLFLMGQDDILAKDALQKTHDAFFSGKNIGAITRPYFWYETDINKPVRAVYPPDKTKNTILSLQDGNRAITAIFGSVGQLSGLAYIRKYIDVPFNEDVFTTHIYPFASILKKHRCIFLKDFTVAIGIKESQTRHVSWIYNKSPTETWVRMFQTIYSDKKYNNIQKLCIKHIVTHYTGLVQIKNFAPKGALMKEILILLKYRWISILHPKFWFYVIITLFLPKKTLIFLTDNYKRHFLAKGLTDIKFETAYND